MLQVNMPEPLTDVQCYKCKTIFSVHPAINLNSPFITDCAHYRRDKEDTCKHDYGWCNVGMQCIRCGKLR